MEVLGVGPHETWMVGDSLEWEIVAPQRLGIYAIWHDGYGVGLPRNSPIRPDRTSAAYRNCCCSRASWRASRAAALLCFMADTAASAQTGPGVGYDRAALTQAICRQYAAAQRGMPYDRCTRSACMRGATACRVSRRRPIPLVIKASCRVLRFMMELPERAECERAEQIERCGPLICGKAVAYSSRQG